MSSTDQEYLVISRGKWDADAAKEDIQAAIDAFYVWIERKIAAGQMVGGQRLATGGATVLRESIVTDGPFGESKEVIGGYWFIRAGSLAEAAQIAAENPCRKFGLFYEIRPIAPEAASAFDVTNETPIN